MHRELDGSSIALETTGVEALAGGFDGQHDLSIRRGLYADVLHLALDGPRAGQGEDVSHEAVEREAHPREVLPEHELADEGEEELEGGHEAVELGVGLVNLPASFEGRDLPGQLGNPPFQLFELRFMHGGFLFDLPDRPLGLRVAFPFDLGRLDTALERIMGDLPGFHVLGDQVIVTGTSGLGGIELALALTTSLRTARSLSFCLPIAPGSLSLRPCSSSSFERTATFCTRRLP